MNTFEAIILGSIQGLTEFLPISSSGHLYLVETYFQLVPSLSFELSLHMGTLAAVVAFFYRDIIALLCGLYRMLIEHTRNDEGVLALKLGVATLLTFPTAYITKQVVVDQFSVTLVGVTLIITAGFILMSEYLRPHTERSLTWTIVVLLGLVQGFAVMPGISRSGLTIAFLLLVGINRKLSARTSFLLSIPTIFGAGLFTLLDTSSRTEVSLSLPIAIGVVTSAAVGYLGIKLMMKLIEGKWVVFVPYCFILGAFLLLFV